MNHLYKVEDGQAIYKAVLCDNCAGTYKFKKTITLERISISTSPCFDCGKEIKTVKDLKPSREDIFRAKRADEIESAKFERRSKNKER